MFFKLFFIAVLAATANAIPLGNGCHWWLLFVTCKGPVAPATPAVIAPPPPPPPCTSCTAPPCPAACTPGIPPSQLALGSTSCPAPGRWPLFDSTGNFLCCGPLHDPPSLGGCAPGAQPVC